MSKDQKQRPRLGRGLSSLMTLSDLPVQASTSESPAATAIAPPAANAETNTVASRQVIPSDAVFPSEVPVAAIVPNPHQPRRHFDETMLQELAQSLKSTGLVQPIVVRKQGDRYELIAGERRWRAARLAGLITIPVIIRDVDSVTQAQMAIVENIHREALNPIERAEAYSSLIKRLGLTQAELAGRLGEDRSSIANHVRLLDLSPQVLEQVRAGQLTLGHAKLLVGISDATEQERLAAATLANGLSVRALEAMIAEPPASAPPRPQASVSAHLADLEKNLARQLGMRVQVRSTAKKGKGRLVIHYSSLDQFDELLGRLGVSAEG